MSWCCQSNASQSPGFEKQQVLGDSEFAPTIAGRNPQQLSDGSIIDDHGFVYKRNANGSITSRVATSEQLSQSGIRLDYDNISRAKPHQSRNARNLAEQTFLDEVVSNPRAGTNPELIADARFPQSQRWQKLEQVHRLPNGDTINVHYQYNNRTGQVVDTKFANPESTALQPGSSRTE